MILETFALITAAVAQVADCRIVEDQRPVTTLPPSLYNQAHLMKRAFTSICGYGIEVPSYSFDCGAGYVCGFNPTSEAFGCCASSSGSSAFGCYFPTVCFDYGSLTITPTGSAAVYTYTCSDSGYPYCATILENGLSNFDCNESPSQTLHLQTALFPSATLLNNSDTSSSTIFTKSSSSSNTSPASTGSTTHIIVGPTSTAPSFSRTQASGSAVASTSTSGGARPVEIKFWQHVLFSIVLIWFLA